MSILQKIIKVILPGFLDLLRTMTTTVITIARVIPPAATPTVIIGDLSVDSEKNKIKRFIIQKPESKIIIKYKMSMLEILYKNLKSN